MWVRVRAHRAWVPPCKKFEPQNASLLVSRALHGVPGCWRGQGLPHRVNTFHGVRLTTCDGAVAPCAAAA